MADPDGSPFGGVRWIVRDPVTGRPELCDVDGRTLPVTVDRAAARLFDPDAGGVVPDVVAAVDPAGVTTSYAVKPVPGVPGLAVAIDRSGVDRAVSGLVETLVNQIAHDVRNYAFTIALQAELGERRPGASPEVKGHLTAVLRQVDALKTFLEQLLLFGRPVTVRPASVDPTELVREQVHLVQFGWKPDAAPLAVSVEVAPDVGRVRWDSRAIGAALHALIDNAARSAVPAPAIVVRVTREQARVFVEVRDCGPGIPADKLALLGIPMRVRRHGGTGLGLAIARKMAAAHGGTLDIETGPAGTTVRLTLPAEVDAG